VRSHPRLCPLFQKEHFVSLRREIVGSEDHHIACFGPRTSEVEHAKTMEVRKYRLNRGTAVHSTMSNLRANTLLYRTRQTTRKLVFMLPLTAGILLLAMAMHAVPGKAGGEYPATQIISTPALRAHLLLPAKIPAKLIRPPRQNLSLRSS
jgi:hypothetical protein